VLDRCYINLTLNKWFCKLFADLMKSFLKTWWFLESQVFVVIRAQVLCTWRTHLRPSMQHVCVVVLILLCLDFTHIQCLAFPLLTHTRIWLQDSCSVDSCLGRGWNIWLNFGLGEISLQNCRLRQNLSRPKVAPDDGFRPQIPPGNAAKCLAFVSDELQQWERHCGAFHRRNGV